MEHTIQIDFEKLEKVDPILTRENFVTVSRKIADAIVAGTITEETGMSLAYVIIRLLRDPQPTDIAVFKWFRLRL